MGATVYQAGRVRAIWVDMGCLTPCPQWRIDRWASYGWLNSDDGILLVREYIKSLDDYWNGSVAKTERLIWVDDYETRIGQPISAAALTELQTMHKAGYSREQYNAVVEARPEYQTGVEMMGKRQTYLDALYAVWGEGQVDDLIRTYALANPGKDYIKDSVIPRLGLGATHGVITDWARQQAQYLSGPAAASTRENLLATYKSVMQADPDEDWLQDKLLDGWTPDQLLQYLRGTDEYSALYGFKPPDMTEAEYRAMRDAFNAVGRWYYRQAGTLQTLTEAEVQALRVTAGITDDALPPGVELDGDGHYVTWSGAWEISEAQLGAMLDAGWTPSEWEQHLRYTQQAIGELDDMNFKGQAIGKVYTEADAAAYKAGGEGAGRIMAEMAKAEHRRSFDTAFALVNGRMPTLADYEILEATYASAEHYYQTQTARQDAEADFASTDELMRRVYGYGADLEQMVGVRLNRAGSGQYEALVQAAEELDRYRLTFREWARRDPTPDDYARFAGMAGPDELQKEISVLENMRSQGPKIKRDYDQYWADKGVSPLTDEEMSTLLGQYQGWGSLQARLDLAEERRKRREESVEMSLRWGAAVTPISYTEFGGSKTPGLKRIGG